MKEIASVAVLCLLAAPLVACSSEDTMGEPGGGVDQTTPHDPATAMTASVDRFSATAGHLQVRDGMNGLPEANAPVDFDQGPFITKGFGPSGELVKYYNFDVQPTAPAPIFVLFREGEETPVEGQLNIIDVLPGDAGYNDFWQIMKVSVPGDYVANTLASLDELSTAGYPMEATDMLVNCPVVPDGSTAELRGGGESSALHEGWYKDSVVEYFTFEERTLAVANGDVPLSPIYVTFNTNPDKPGGGPGSGFKTDASGTQTHNVAATIPMDEAYSPLWAVSIYDNADFASVHDLASASAANVLAPSVATVNCPIVSVQTED